MSSELKAKGTKAFLWDVIGKLANSGMGFIITLFLARLLEPSEFGLIAIILVLVGVISIFSDGGLAAALIQKKKLLPIHYSSVFYFNLITAILLAVITYFSSNWIASFYNNEMLNSIIEVMSVSFIFAGLSSVQVVQFKRKLNYVMLTKITIISSITSGVIGIVMAYNGAGVWSLVAQSLSMGFLSSVLLWKTSHWRPGAMFSFKALLYLWRFGFNLFIVNILNAVFARLDMLIIGKIYSMSILGFFDRAKHLNQMVVSYTAGSLQSVLFPVLSRIQMNLPKVQNAVSQIYYLLSFFVFLLIGIFYLTAEELIVVLFSEKWLPSAVYFKVVVLSTFASVYSSLLVNVIISRGKSKLYLKIDIYKKLFFLINLYIGFSYGLMHYIYGFVIVSIFAFLIDLYMACKEIKIPMRNFLFATLKQIIIIFIAVYSVFVVSSIMNYNVYMMLFIKGISLTTIYVILSWMSNTLVWQHTLKETLLLMHKLSTKHEN